MITSQTDQRDKKQGTAPGNYFISNYPPYSFWTTENVPEALTALDRPPKSNTPFGIYLHIPFCRKRCHFCYFRIYTGVKSSEIRSYIDATLHELSLYRQKSFTGGRKPNFVYFGGGTPSFLSSEQLLTVTNTMKEAFPWSEAEEVTFECEPGTLTERKIHVIKEIGVTRLSLGVENFDDHILQINGRAHRSKEIGRAYEWARKMDFPQINIDLIAGMLEETQDKWEKTIAKAIKLEPDSITIYQMEIPYNTTIYKQMKEAGQLFAPVADWQTKRAWVNYAFEALEDAGYTVTSAYTAVKDPQKATFVYRDQLWRGADLMALGVASFSHINGTHFQNEHDMDQYLARLARGELPIFRALTLNDEELLLRELILQFKLGHVSIDYFLEKFGVDIRQRFTQQIERLFNHDLLVERNNRLSLTRSGLLQVDELLHDFFLERHKATRYS